MQGPRSKEGKCGVNVTAYDYDIIACSINLLSIFYRHYMPPKPSLVTLAS